MLDAYAGRAVLRLDVTCFQYPAYPATLAGSAGLIALIYPMLRSYFDVQCAISAIAHIVAGFFLYGTAQICREQAAKAASPKLLLPAFCFRDKRRESTSFQERPLSRDGVQYTGTCCCCSAAAAATQTVDAVQRCFHVSDVLGSRQLAGWSSYHAHAHCWCQLVNMHHHPGHTVSAVLQFCAG